MPGRIRMPREGGREGVGGHHLVAVVGNGFEERCNCNDSAGRRQSALSLQFALAEAVIS
jgi:hypothetical protein